MQVPVCYADFWPVAVIRCGLEPLRHQIVALSHLILLQLRLGNLPRLWQVLPPRPISANSISHSYSSFPLHPDSHHKPHHHVQPA